MNRPVLECRGLRFWYEGEAVLDGLDLTIEAGEVAVLMGPSGCGKSTLAHCVAGLYPEYAGRIEGEVVIMGEKVGALRADERAQRVAMLFQNPDDQFCMDTPLQELCFALENVRYEGDMAARAEALLAGVDMAGWKEKRLASLSGGMKQKVALACALATGARLLVLDEPFANIDPAAAKGLAAMLARLAGQGIAILVVDHRFDHWRGICSRVLLMDGAGGLVDGQGVLPEELEAKRALFEGLGVELAPEWPAAVLPVGGAVAVEAEGLEVWREKRRTLGPLGFAAEAGSITAIVGPCGSGKTTLLWALAGLLKYKGKLHRGGQPGIVFQDPRCQFLTVKARDEVAYSLRAAGVPEGEIEARAMEWLEEFGLAGKAEASPYTLSGGQQRRLAVLCMLAGEQQVLLLDEPTYAQDGRNTRFMLELLRKRAADGLCVVFTTHDEGLAYSFAGRVLRMEEGVLWQVKGAEADDGAA